MESKVPPLVDVSGTLRDYDAIVVYEGLPHQVSERAVREVERQTKKTFQVGDELLYERPLAVSDKDRQALDSLFHGGALYVKWTGMKLCGEFHADYAIEWRKKDARVGIALLCFGCREMIVLSSGRSSVVDLTSEGFEATRKILTKYRQERPQYAPLGPMRKPESTPPPQVEIRSILP